MSEDPDLQAQRIARQSLDRDDATGWFENLYSAASDGTAVIPWDRGFANPLLTEWFEASGPDGSGKSAVVIGAGTGWDAELVADHGYQTTAFDISPTAVETARRNHPDSQAQYVVANLLDQPAEWHHAFDLVIEIYTVQALPISLQAAAVQKVGELVAPGGTLVVIASPRADGQPDDEIEGPPWPLTRGTVESFASAPDLRLISLDQVPAPTDPTAFRWRAEFLRD
ncbi:methyltransferase domain-containing protein [Kribbella albertanoniae]|uniref:Class I SAM-dependent methyltransferase n=1 Tax=Kribbella albertanoniae TaxID=1266829 RepID=A0A4V2XNL6_9ACTN|nr:class I SAM-dependent methyltransferase [Kribbella albertanoniae]TDC18726.1 class I SAM-dependent methyltransferase [Kribbella albertanoniae]